MADLPIRDAALLLCRYRINSLWLVVFGALMGLLSAVV